MLTGLEQEIFADGSVFQIEKTGVLRIEQESQTYLLTRAGVMCWTRFDNGF